MSSRIKENQGDGDPILYPSGRCQFRCLSAHTATMDTLAAQPVTQVELLCWAHRAFLPPER